MVAQIKMMLLIIACTCLSGCDTSVNIDDNHNETAINMESYAIDDNKAYIHIDEVEGENYRLYIYKNMGDIEYAYYTVNVQDIEDGYNISIVKKNAVNDEQCSNILNEVVVLKEYPKVLEITYNQKKIEIEKVVE